MEIINASGSAHVATCCNCGASLTYPVWVETKNKAGEIVRCEAFGKDCFEIVFGQRYDSIPSKYRIGNRFDVTKYHNDREAILKAVDIAIQNEDARVAAVATENAWLIDALQPLGCVSTYVQCKQGIQYTTPKDNFFGGIITSLRTGQRATELPDRAKRIICEALAKSEGRKNSKAYSKRYDEIESKLFPEHCCPRCGSPRACACD